MALLVLFAVVLAFVFVLCWVEAAVTVWFGARRGGTGLLDEIVAERVTGGLGNSVLAILALRRGGGLVRGALTLGAPARRVHEKDILLRNVAGEELGLGVWELFVEIPVQTKTYACVW